MSRHPTDLSKVRAERFHEPARRVRAAFLDALAQAGPAVPFAVACIGVNAGPVLEAPPLRYCLHVVSYRWGRSRVPLCHAFPGMLDELREHAELVRRDVERRRRRKRR